jgi:uncharacterized membrane protein
MNTNLRRLLCASLLLTAASRTPAAASTAYTMVVLPELGVGNSEARAINNHNQIVGTSGDWVAFWDNAGVHSRGAGFAFDINERGQLAGTIGHQAYSWDEFGVAHPLSTVSGWMDTARTINNNGVVAGDTELVPILREYGCIWDQGGRQQLPGYGQFSGIISLNDSGIASGLADGAYPLRWTGSQWQLLPSLGGNASMGRINQSGTIVGGSGGYAVLWNTAGLQLIGKLPGYSGSYATSINEQGVVVGGTVYSGSYGRGWVWNGAEMQALDPLPGDEFSEANDINDNGWIVGMSGTYGGAAHAVAWIPVPEPSAGAILLAGLACLARRAHLRTRAPAAVGRVRP